ncbi:MAG: hypothetical protein QOH49_1794 [Acidobacteriota bacterium]|jgi:uncharacterized membrane protein|nr:hypothetical protein [Acidobacteriota bacterium]
MRKLKTILKYLLCVLFVVAGLNHFINPALYLKIMPPYLPWHLFFVYLSGFFEVALGLLLLIPAFTRIAAWGLIALLIAVFPANIHMATNPQLYSDIPPLALWLRLPLQAVLIAWAYWYTRPAERKPAGRVQ